MTAPVSIPETIFERAIAISDAAERARYLDRACDGNSALRRDAERLVQDHFQAGNFLEQPGLVLDVTTTPPATERIGTLIGPYKLLEQIGEGGMGLVYVAEQTHPVRRRVALKIIKPGMDTRQVIARFEAERQALAMMDHPNIARILDAGTTGEVASASDWWLEGEPKPSPALATSTSHAAGGPYFVMELVRGIPITDFCEQKQISVPERLKLVIDVCHAVQHAHQKGIIHRDLKPSNVLVTLHDGTPVVKVIDFGVAKAIGAQLTDRTIYTAHLQLVGTPLYMSPEQAELSGLDVDTRSDVYSLGVMLYELLTGTTPFDKDRLKSVGFDELRRIIREEEPETVSARIARTKSSRHTPCAVPSSLAPSHQPLAPRRSELDWIVMKSLEKDRNRRYESASSFAADIQRYLSGDLVHACPPSSLYRFRKFAKKNKTALTTAALLAASLLLGITLSLWQAIRATAAEAQATANEAKAKTEEQKATALARSEAEQRKQAEKSLQSALEAVGRMLANVSDEDLNELPRVGPLRRKQLKEAIAFIERIPISPQVAPAIRFQLGETWQRVAQLHVDVDEPEEAIQSYQASIDILTSLVAEHPNNVQFRVSLASAYDRAGWAYLHGLHSLSRAEDSFRHAGDLIAELIRQEPQNDRWLTWQSRQLCSLSIAITDLNRPTEALRYATRALELSESVKEPDPVHHARVLRQLADLRLAETPDEGRDLYRRAIGESRALLARSNLMVDQQRLAQHLGSAAWKLRERYPDDAEKYWDESIELWRKVCGPTPRLRTTASLFARALEGQSWLLRHRAGHEATTKNSAKAGDRLLKAEALYQEALTHQRNNVSRFQLVADRFQLVQMLHEEANYLLGNDGLNEAVSGRSKLQADALLTEAIQLCRALAAEFPDNTDYKSRLADLEKLHAQHFGQKDEAAPPSPTREP